MSTVIVLWLLQTNEKCDTGLVVELLSSEESVA